MSDFLKEKNNQYVRPHDHWQCSLDETQPCGGDGTHIPKEGQCQPQPSLRLQRGIFTISCTAMVIGLLVACWNSPKRNEFLAPGPLSGSHAQILVGKGTDRCASCHGAGDKTLANWIRDAVSLGTHIPVSQSQLCMDCHDSSLNAEFAMLAHSMPTSDLTLLTENTVSTNSALGFPDPRNAAGQLACATCHREHHGAEFNLTALTDNQCQTCHVNHLHSFERDHPEFTDWPFPERTGITFDHVSHGVKHFAARNESFNCQQCHIDDADGNVKLVDKFENTCAKCHQEDVVGEQNPALTLFQMPMLDTEALAKGGYSIGLWPDECHGDFDGQLPPAMKLMLMSDVRTAAILNRHGKNFDFADLDPTDPDDLSDAATLAWSIKELLFGLTVNGGGEVRRRLDSTLTSELDSADLRGITFGMNEAFFARAQQRWVPRLLSEMNARQKEMNGDHRVMPNQVFARPVANQDDATLAENPLANLYQQNQRRRQEPARSNRTPSTGANQSAGRGARSNQRRSNPPVQYSEATPRDTTNPTTGTFDTMEINRATGDSGRRITNSHVPGSRSNQELQAQGTGEVLAANPLAGLNSGRRFNVLKAPDANPPAEALNGSRPPTGAKPPVIAGGRGDGEGNIPDDTEAEIRRAIANLESSWKGGWQRDDEAFKISYRVTNHVDPLLMGWTDMVMKNHTNLAVQKSNLFDSLNSTSAAGQCRSCHTTDQQNDGTMSVNWMPKYRDVSVRGFTRFSHRPHDIQTSLQDCNGCHQLDKSKSNAHLSEGFDPTQFVSNFAPISKTNCASCHRKGGAPSGSVDCHNYHIGSKISSKK